MLERVLTIFGEVMIWFNGGILIRALYIITFGKIDLREKHENALITDPLCWVTFVIYTVIIFSIGFYTYEYNNVY